jgi:hypothetical protein
VLAKATARKPWLVRARTGPAILDRKASGASGRKGIRIRSGDAGRIPGAGYPPRLPRGAAPEAHPLDWFATTRDQAEEWSLSDDAVLQAFYGALSAVSSSGVRVTQESALRSVAVLACLIVRAETSLVGESRRAGIVLIELEIVEQRRKGGDFSWLPTGLRRCPG